jgi:BatD DUF11 like domain
MKQKLLALFCMTLAAYFPAQVLLISETNVKKINKNEVFYLNIALNIQGEEFQQESPIKLPDLSKFDIMGISTRQNVLQRGHEEVYQTFLQVGLMPHKSGRVKIGSALVQINGKMYKSEPFDVLVNGQESKSPSAYACDQNADMSIELTPKNLYQNQAAVANVSLKAKCLAGLRKVAPVQIKQSPDLKIFPIENKDNVIEEISLHGEKFLSQIQSKLVCIPQKSGFINIAPMINAKNATLQNAVAIKVKALPPAPAGFKNAVGDFKIDLTTNKTKVKANETFEVVLKISGQGNINNLELPEILQNPNYKVFNASQERQVSAINGQVSGQVEARFVLMALKDAPFEVKFEALKFFNPDTGRYESSEIAPLNIGEGQESSVDKPAQINQNPASLSTSVARPEQPKTPETEAQNTWSWWPILLGASLLLFVVLILKKAFASRQKTPARPISSEEISPMLPIKNQEKSLEAQPEPDIKPHWQAMANAEAAGDKNAFFEAFFAHYQTLNLANYPTAQQAKMEQFYQKMKVEKYSPFVDVESLGQYLAAWKMLAGA